MNKIRLLWIGDSPASTTGFGRVSQGVLESLYSTDKYDISVLGINHSIGDPHKYEGMFRIYPARAQGNVYGFNRVEEVVNKEKPHVIIINNDLWIVKEYVKHIPAGNRIFTYSPVDALPVNEEWTTELLRVNPRIGTYTEFAKSGILKACKEPIPIDIIGHGVDTDEFYPMRDARKFMGLSEDVFIVQNVNRNQPRKRIDLFIKALDIWTKRLPKSDRDNIFFYYHGMLKDVGWNVIDLAKRWGVDDRFLITDQEGINPSSGVSLDYLCKIYNLANVHVINSMGEGWGLSPFESAACGVAQVVPNHSACTELWSGTAPLINIKYWEVLTGGINTEGGVIDVDHLVDILNDLYINRDKTKKIARDCYNYVKQERFSWAFVAKQFDNVVVDMLKDNTWLSKKYEVGKTPEVKDELSSNENN